jgi:hypothetical protein
MVEEASAAAGSLEEQSRELASAVGAFTLDAQQHGLVAPAPKHVAPKAAEARKTADKTEPKKRIEVKAPHTHTLAAKVSAKKGNGHLEEGWQEF